MKYLPLVVLCSMLLFGVRSGIGAPVATRLLKTGTRGAEWMPGSVIVKFKATTASAPGGPVTRSVAPQTALASIMQAYAVTGAIRPFMRSVRTAAAAADDEYGRIYELSVPTPISIPRMLDDLRRNPAVEYAEPKYIHHTTYEPNDINFSTLWHLTIIKAREAWDVTKGDSSVVIGLVDSGTDYTHPDLAANIWTNAGESGTDSQGRDKRTNGVDDDKNGFVDDWHGWDFVGKTGFPLKGDNDPNPYDGNEHGTHTAGIASAVADNHIGIAGIGFRTKIMVTKHGIDTKGDNSIYNGDDGIIYCIDNGANIVSCSWGGAAGSQYEADIVRYALKKNVLIVASAGNGGDDQLSDDMAVEPEYPGAFIGVLSVGATDAQDHIGYFSNYGSPNKFKVFAPGLSINSTLPQGLYGTMSGTSMAAPMAAGLAALVKGQHRDWSAAQLMFQLCGTADNIDMQNPHLIGKLGYGRINAKRAVTETIGAPAPDIALVSVSFDDARSGNGNGILEPGESADITIMLENQWGDASDVAASVSTTSWAATVTQPSASFGSMRGIMNMDSTRKSNTSAPFTISIRPDAIPTVVPVVIRVTTSNGGAREFQTMIPVLPSVLLVDDDDGQNNVEGYYAQALSQLGVVYEQWDHSAKGTPPIDLMKRYNTVIWFTEWNVPTLDSADRAVLSQYLDSGGKKLFLSGQENGWDLADPTGTGTEYESSLGASQVFYETYLKGKFVADDAGTSYILGIAGDEIGDGLTFKRNQPGRGAGQNPDVIDAVNGGKSIFTYSGGPYAGRTAGVSYKGAYSLVSLSFGGFESITDSAARVTVMDRVLKFLHEYSVTVTQMPDNQEPPFTVNATIAVNDPNPSVELLWTMNGELPYNRVPMTKTGSVYSATIMPVPGRLPGKEIEYFVLVKTSAGFLPYEKHTFKVSIPTSVVQTSGLAPSQFALTQNYPNPFNPATQIRFSLPEQRHVTLTVYDALGRAIALLADEVRPPGEYTVSWEARGLSSGVYFYRLTAGSYTSLRSMVLLR